MIDPQDETRVQPQTTEAHQETADFDSAALARQTVGGGGPGAAQSGTLLEDGAKLGRYTIKKVLGRGGMGSVYLAHDEQLDRLVALKTPRLENDPGGTLMQRFLREARAAAKFTHPNICAIYDVGEHAGRPFIAMAYVEGRALADYVTAGKSQPEREVARVIRKVALALHEAHGQGILHRDLKPANIMIDRRGEPIVMDFGLACGYENKMETRLTQEGNIIGTPTYMSPEQIEGEELGPASDIYSLGVLLYEALAGRCPFEGSVVSVIGQVLHKEPPRLNSIRADVSPTLMAICNKAMAKNPADRYASMKEFAKALAAFLKGKPPADSATTPAEVSQLDVDAFADLPDMNVHGATTQLAPLPSRSASAWHESRQVWIVAGAGGAAVLVLLIVGLLVGAGRWFGDDGGQSEGTRLAQRDDDASEPPEDTQTVVVQQGAVGGTEDATTEGELRSIPPAPIPAPPGPAVDEADTGIEPSARSADEANATNDGGQPSRGTDRDDPVATPPESDQGNPFRPPVDERSQPAIPRLLNLRADFRRADKNKDGKLDRSEAALHIIRRADANDDDALSVEEMEQALKRLKERLFTPPTADELKRLPSPPRGGQPPRPPFGQPREDRRRPPDNQRRN